MENEKKDRIYWNVSNRIGDRFTVYRNGKVIADHVTFDECYNLVRSIVAENKKV